MKVLSCDYAGEDQRIIRFKIRSRNLALSADELPRAMTGHRASLPSISSSPGCPLRVLGRHVLKSLKLHDMSQ